MRIDQLKVENFAGFTRQQFVFSPRFNLLVGANGCGKTSLLKALAAGLAPVMDSVSGSANILLADEARWVQHEISGRVRYERSYPVTLELEGWLCGEAMAWQARAKAAAGSDQADFMAGLTEGFDPSNSFSAHVAIVNAARQNHTLPLLAFYSAERRWPLSHVTVEHAVRQQESRLAGYVHWQHAAADVAGLESWIIAKSLERLERLAEHGPILGGGPLDELDLVNQVIQLAIPEAKGLRYDIKYRQLMLEWLPGSANTPTTPFDTLSDGQRGMVALLADMARRMCLLNPQLGNSVLRDTPGVVLIDELDMHLHPAWQRRLPGVLKQAFPQVQFIAASHSPQIIGELPLEEIWLMRDNQVIGHPEHALGLSSSEVLEELMDSKARNPAIHQQLQAIERLIEDDQLEIAQDRLTQLETQIGQIPDVVRARSAITALSWQVDDIE